MTRSLALALLLSTSPALAGDRPERVALTPRTVAPEPAFVASEHPVIVVLAISGAILTAAAVIAMCLELYTGFEPRHPPPFPGCEICR